MIIEDLNKFSPVGITYDLSGVTVSGELVNDRKRMAIRILIDGAKNSPYYGGGLMSCLTLHCLEKLEKISSELLFSNQAPTAILEQHLSNLKIIKTESSLSRNSQIIHLHKFDNDEFQRGINKAIEYFTQMNNCAILKDRAFFNLENHSALLRAYEGIKRESFYREKKFGITPEACESIIANAVNRKGQRKILFKPMNNLLLKIFNPQRLKRRNEFVKNAVIEFNEKIKLIEQNAEEYRQYSGKILSEETHALLERVYLEHRQKFNESWKRYSNLVYPNKEAGIFEYAIAQSAIKWLEEKINTRAAI